MNAIDRRGMLRLGGVAALGALLTGCAAEAAAESEHGEEEHAEAPTPEEALERLKQGNARFVGGNAIHPAQGTKTRAELTAGQHPYATILSCVDSRVPPELVFDEGLGNLFVSRTAGQVVDNAVLGSVQFGAHELHIPLIVVMGHTKCGAVKATVEAVEKNSPASGTAIDTLVAAIKPAVLAAEEEHPADLLDAAIEENVKSIADKIAAAPVISGLIAEKKVAVVAAKYDLATGKVKFLD